MTNLKSKKIGKELQINDVIEINALQTIHIVEIIKNPLMNIKVGFTMVKVIKKSPGIDNAEAITTIENDKTYNII